MASPSKRISRGGIFELIDWSRSFSVGKAEMVILGGLTSFVPCSGRRRFEIVVGDGSLSCHYCTKLQTLQMAGAVYVYGKGNFGEKAEPSHGKKGKFGWRLSGSRDQHQPRNCSSHRAERI